MSQLVLIHLWSLFGPSLVYLKENSHMYICTYTNSLVNAWSTIISMPKLCESLGKAKHWKKNLNFFFSINFTQIFRICPKMLQFLTYLLHKQIIEMRRSQNLRCPFLVPSRRLCTHWSKWTLIPFLIWRTFDHSRRWEMIKEF